MFQPYLFTQCFWDFCFNHYIGNQLVCKMEVDKYSNVDQKMDGYQRYCRLHAIVDEVGKGPATRPQEWYDEHYAILDVYDKYFAEGFSDLHKEIIDSKFRKNCVALDKLLEQLLREYETLRWFSLYDYMVFNMTMIDVIDTVFEYTDQDDLTGMFKKMNV